MPASIHKPSSSSLFRCRDVLTMLNSHNDLVTRHNFRRECVANFFPLRIKGAAEIPACLSEGLGLHFMVSKVPLSLTATPFSCSSFSSIRLPFISSPPLSVQHSSSLFLPLLSLSSLMSLCHFLLAVSSCSPHHLLLQFQSMEEEEEVVVGGFF